MGKKYCHEFFLIFGYIVFQRYTPSRKSGHTAQGSSIIQSEGGVSVP